MSYESLGLSIIVVCTMWGSYGSFLVISTSILKKNKTINPRFPLSFNEMFGKSVKYSEQLTYRNCGG